MQETTTSMANIIAIIALVVSIFSGLAVAYFSAWVSMKYQKKNRQSESTKALLEGFYGPIISLLTENDMLYREFGPSTFSGKPIEVISAKGEAWNSIKENVVVPNLFAVRGLIQKYWLQIIASEKEYFHQLLLHCTAFCEYDKVPNEMYHRYKYKPEWMIAIGLESQKLLRKLEE